MSDYISKSELIDFMMRNVVTLTEEAHDFKVEIIDAIKNQPTISETEIIRKALERIIHSINLIKDCADEGFEDGCNACIHKIKIELYDLKEECGINE